jgi:hypothetical protein
MCEIGLAPVWVGKPYTVKEDQVQNLRPGMAAAVLLDRLSGGPGRDRVRGGKGRDRASGVTKSDRVRQVERIGRTR